MPATERLLRRAQRVVWVVVTVVLVAVTGPAAVAAASTPASVTGGVGAPAGLCTTLATVSPVAGALCGTGTVAAGSAAGSASSGDSDGSGAAGSSDDGGGSGLGSMVCTVAPIINPVVGLACPSIVGGVEQVVKVAGLILNPERAYEYFANDLKETAITWFTYAVSYVVNETSFDPGQTWWRDTYAATAGLGLAVLAVMALLVLRKVATGKIGPKQAATIASEHLPVALVMMFFGPPVAWVIARFTASANTAVIAWIGPDAIEAMTNGAIFSQMTASSGIGVVIGLVIFLLLLLAVLGVFGTWITQSLSTYMLGAVAGLAWGMTIDPAWRKKAIRVPFMVLGLMLSKPAGLIVLGIITKYVAQLSPSDVFDEPVRLLISGITFIVALVMIAFAPWSVLRYFPLLPDGSESTHSSGPTALTSAAAGAGSVVTSMMMLQSRGGGGGPGFGSGGGKSSAGKNDSAQANSAKASGQGAASGTEKSPAGKSSSSGGASSQKSTGTSGSGAQAGAGAGSAKTGAGAKVGAGGAGAGAKGAASAAGGAATGGVLLAVQLAAAGVGAVANKAKEAASAAAPQAGGEMR